MKSLTEFILENMEASIIPLDEARKRYEIDYGKRFKATLIDKNNYNKERLQELTEKILSAIDHYDSAVIDWQVDTDNIHGRLPKGYLKKPMKKTHWLFNPEIKPKDSDEIISILEEFHNDFPNKSTLVFSIVPK